MSGPFEISIASGNVGATITIGGKVPPELARMFAGDLAQQVVEMQKALSPRPTLDLAAYGLSHGMEAVESEVTTFIRNEDPGYIVFDGEDSPAKS